MPSLTSKPLFLAIFIIAIFLAPSFLSRTAPPELLAKASQGVNFIADSSQDQSMQLDYMNKAANSQEFQDNSLILSQALAGKISKQVGQEETAQAAEEGPEDDDPAPTELTEFVPLKSALDESGQASFNFTLKKVLPATRSIEVILLNVDLDEPLIICANYAGKPVELNDSRWNSTTGVLQIVADQLTKGTKFDIVVYAAQKNRKDLSTITFSIECYQSPEFKRLSFRSIITGNVSEADPKYFSLSVDLMKSPRVIIHPDTKSMIGQLSVSAFSSKAQSINLNSNYAATSYHDVSSAWEMDVSVFKKLCSESTSTSKGKYCTIYLIVEAEKTKQTIDFTLRLDTQAAYLNMTEGIQRSIHPLTKRKMPIRLQYSPISKEDTFLLPSMYGSKFTAYVKVVNTSNYSQETLPWPASNDTEFSALIDAFKEPKSLMIPGSTYDKCWDKTNKSSCMLIATILPASDTKLGAPTVLNFLITQNMEHATLNKTKTGTLASRQYKYYSLTLNQVQSRIIISLSSEASTRLYFSVSRGEDTRPTRAGGEFSSKSYSGMTYLEVGPSNMKKDDSMQGTWVIGVTTDNIFEGTLNYSLTIINGDIRKLSEFATSVEAFIPASHFSYFSYFSVVAGNLTFPITKIEGAAKYYLAVINPNITIAENIFKLRSSNYSGSLDQVKTIVEVKETSPLNCSLCTYLIGIEAINNSQVGVTVLFNDNTVHLDSNSPLKDSVDVNAPSKYRTTLRSLQYDLNILVDSGAPTIYISNTSNVNQSNSIWKCIPSQNGYSSFRINNINLGHPYEVAILGCGNDKPITMEFGDLYFLATADVPSVYSIGISGFDRSQHIVRDERVAGFLNKNESDIHDILFTWSDRSTVVKFTVYKDKFNTIWKNVSQSMFTLLYRPTKSVDEFSEPILPFRSSVVQYTTAHSPELYTAILEYPKLEFARHKLEVRNNMTNPPFSYSLVLFPKFLLELPVNGYYLSRTAVNSSDLYSIKAIEPGVFTIEIFVCAGQVQVSHASSMFSLNTGHKTSADSYTTFKTEELGFGEIVYINVTSVLGVKNDDYITDDEAIYRIKTTFYNANNQDFAVGDMILGSGNDGNVAFSSNNDGKLRVSFNDITQNGKDPTSRVDGLSYKTSYELLIGKDEAINRYFSICDDVPVAKGVFKNRTAKVDLKTFESEQIGSESDTDRRRFIDTSLPAANNTGYVTLRVSLSGVKADGTVMWRYPVSYKTSEVVIINPPKPPGSFKVWILILILVVLVTIGGCCWYRKRLQDRKLIQDSGYSHIYSQLGATQL